MSSNKYYVWLMLMLFISEGVVSAKDYSDTLLCRQYSCGCHADQSPAGIMTGQPHKKQEWMFSYHYMNMGMKGIAEGLSPRENKDVFVDYLMSPEKMSMHMHMLMGMYGISDRLTLMTTFQYEQKEMTMIFFDAALHRHGAAVNANTSPYHTMNTQGIGDIQVAFLLGLINKEKHLLFLNGGLSITTGSIDHKGKPDDVMYPNERYPYMMQTGSGTWDALSGINYQYKQNLLRFNINLSSRIIGGYNDVGYQSPNKSILNTWVSYQWLSSLNSSVRLEGTLSGKIKREDPSLYYYNEPSANPNNYGGKQVNLFFGSVYQTKKGILSNNRIALEYGIPLYQNLNGMQLKFQYMFHASLAFIF